MAKCHFGLQEVHSLGRTIKTEEVAPQKQKDLQIFRKIQISTIQESFSTIYWIFKLLSKLFLRLAERLTPFFQQLKTTETKAKILIIPDIMKQSGEINAALDRCCQLALRQPQPGKQLVLMTDASLQAAGYAMLIEDNPNRKNTSTRKTYGPLGYGSKTYTPSQIKMSNYTKELLPISLAFIEFGHNFWAATKPVTIVIDIKSVTRFFPTKQIPPTLRYVCDFVLQINFAIAHIHGKMTTKTDFLFRSGMDPYEKSFFEN